MTTRINTQLTEKGIELILTPAAENALLEKGYDPTYGARQLRRTIQKHIEDPLAEAIVRGQLVDSARIEVDVEGGNFVFREAQPQAADAPLCYACGSKMQPAGSCYVCSSCGATSGCS